MKIIRCSIALSILLPALAFAALDLESGLKEAVRLSNLGKTQEAISLLIPLSQQYSKDSRVFLSLG
jgi:hypothetical protein